MKYLLVNKYDEIITKVDLGDDVGVSGATTYFQGLKQMPDRNEFDKLWKVMSEKTWDVTFKSALQNRQNSRKYEWWKDIGEGGELDE